jgi:hypothetical protein
MSVFSRQHRLLLASCFCAVAFVSGCFSPHKKDRSRMANGDELVHECMRVLQGYCLASDKLGKDVLLRYVNGLVIANNEKTVIEVDNYEIENLVTILDRLLRGNIFIDMHSGGGAGVAVNQQDLPELKSDRERFDYQSALRKCLRHFDAGGMPERVRSGKEKNVYIFECVLPGMRDSGYFISVKNHHHSLAVVAVDFYNYDLIR